MAHITAKSITIEKFEAILAENPGRLLELIDGEIVEKLPTEEHGEIVLRLGGRLQIYVETHRLGRVSTEARHHRPEDPFNDRLPDVSFIAGERESIKKGSIPQMPDLAVEVKSPDDTYKTMAEKAEYYLRNGSQLVWLVYPAKQEVEVFSLEAADTLQRQILTLDDSLSGGSLIPGFELLLKTLFNL